MIKSCVINPGGHFRMNSYEQNARFMLFSLPYIELKMIKSCVINPGGHLRMDSYEKKAVWSSFSMRCIENELQTKKENEHNMSHLLIIMRKRLSEAHFQCDALKMSFKQRRKTSITWAICWYEMFQKCPPLLEGLITHQIFKKILRKFLKFWKFFFVWKNFFFQFFLRGRLEPIEIY